MEMTVMIALLSLILTLTIATLIQVLFLTGKVSKLCGQYETHLKGCNIRFEAIEGRLEKADL